MPAGLEIYDANGRKLFGMDKSVLRITKVLYGDKELGKFRQENDGNRRFFIFASAFVDLDKYPNELLITDHPEAMMMQLEKFTESFLVGEFNVSNR